ELLAAVTADEIALPYIRPERESDLLEHFVTGRMALLVINRFEVIDIDHDAADGPAGNHARIPVVVKLRKQSPAVQAAGQWIERRQQRQLPVLPTNVIARSF